MDRRARESYVRFMSKHVPFAIGVLLLCAGCSGLGLSPSQAAFVRARGLPIAFTLSFASAELDASGLAVRTPERRLEVWVYPGSPARIAGFDNGLFVDEQSLGAPLSAPRLSVSPGEFAPTSARADVVAALGPPARVETADLGGASLEVLRYDDPDIVAVSFVDGEITSVVAGLQVQP
jgi:hypothetical protein